MCHFFQQGKCRKGKDCTYLHEKNSDFKPPLCREIAQGRECHRGAACKFSHDKDHINAEKDDTAVRADGLATAATESIFKEWRYNIPQKPTQARPLGHAMSKFCQQALALVKTDPGTVQEVVKKLAEGGGMLRVSELLGQDFEHLSDQQLARMFDAQLLPFFQTITHKNVAQLALLQDGLTSIYQYIFGIGGLRAVPLFKAVTRHLSSLELGGEREDGLAGSTSVAERFEACVAVLHKVLEVNSTALVTEGFIPSVECIASIVDGPLDANTRFQLQPALRNLAKIQQRLGIAKNIATPEDKSTSTRSKPRFFLARDMPGELSEAGPRHDNDFVNIQDISILPTLHEIQSSRNEYLPLTDPERWHLGGVEGLLDRQFRLLREDTVGQLRDAAKLELERLQSPESAATDNVKRRGARTFVYQNVSIRDFAMDSRRGLEFVLSFDQPRCLRLVSRPKRKEWWESQKRLESEALICLLHANGSAIFMMVTPMPHQAPGSASGKDAPAYLQNKYDLASDQERAHVVARLHDSDNASELIMQALNQGPETSTSLVEFPGVLLPAFEPTLHALQTMSKTVDMPFADVLTATGDEETTAAKPPAYTTKPGFKFDLSTLAKDGKALSFAPGDSSASKDVAQRSTLDPAQAEALTAALSRSLALIQGPPGTGKSFVGVAMIKALLANKDAANLGPIICVCYTNHALDQLLEHLVDGDVKQIIRIGSRCRSERLAELNLRVVSRGEPLTKAERSDKREGYQKITSEADEINNILKQLNEIGFKAVENHIQVEYMRHYSDIFSDEYENAQANGGGWQKVTPHRGHFIEHWLRGTAGPRDRQLPLHEMQTSDVIRATDLNHYERAELYQSWVNEIQSELTERLSIALKSYKCDKTSLDQVNTTIDQRALAQANIVGITTSGLARNFHLLSAMGSKVLVCEEAGEVLEAHLLTALLPSIEHAILIGDHLQLRPQVQNYGLSSESHQGEQYALDLSVFERLVKPRNLRVSPLPFSTLQTQRRMHPSISNLIRTILYPALEDSPSVSSYPSVSGMRHRLFWMNHEAEEEEGADPQSTSHTNSFEVGMVAALVSHLVRQGVYKAADIAVLTPYLGQLRKIRQRLSSSFEITLSDKDLDALEKEGVETKESNPLNPRAPVARGTLLQALRVATVDNFQGEEAKVVVVSLVRSNKNRKCGFLRTPNRINVLLSRAKHGMYIIGNAQTSQHVPVWAQVLEQLEADGNLGGGLELQCPRHKDTPMRVTKPEDFLQYAPEAGCNLRCAEPLACGHACVNSCHSEMLHDAVFCQKACFRTKPGCEHPCQKACGEDCDPKCLERVPGIDVQLPCGHQKEEMLCYEHQDPSLATCYVREQYKVPGCGHVVEELCGVNVNTSHYRCSGECGAQLPCGHTCKKPCHRCRKPVITTGTLGNDTSTEPAKRTVPNDREDMVVNHGPCRQVCDRDYSTCTHRCKASCHGEEACPLCQSECEVSCKHWKCKKKCSEPCVLCAEPQCSSECKHSSCQMPCSAPCDWLPCNERCTKVLTCGHQCPSLDGELCPTVKFCQICAPDDVKAMQADLVMFETYGETDLDEDPVVIPSCGHVFTVSSLDGLMDMQKHYDIDPSTGKVLALKTTSEPFSSDEMKQCPTCRRSLHGVARYGRIVRRAILDINTKKFTAWSNREHEELARRLLVEQDRLIKGRKQGSLAPGNLILAGNIKHQLEAVRKLDSVFSWYRATFEIRKAITAFLKKLKCDGQPLQKVHDLVETARRGNADGNIAPFTFNEASIRMPQLAQAGSLLLRCELILLGDVIARHQQGQEESPKHGSLKVKFAGNREQCEAAMEEAEKAMSLKQQVESRVYWASFAALERSVLDAEPAGSKDASTVAELDKLTQAAFAHLKEAERLSAQLPAQKNDLLDEIQESREMLHDSTYKSEMRMVVTAMAGEFSGTGHWYRCANGHPFTIGECGMPMEQATCPACGSGIGGQNHRAVDGVQHARDIEERFGRLHV